MDLSKAFCKFDYHILLMKLERRLERKIISDSFEVIVRIKCNMLTLKTFKKSSFRRQGFYSTSIYFGKFLFLPQINDQKHSLNQPDPTMLANNTN